MCDHKRHIFYFTKNVETLCKNIFIYYFKESSNPKWTNPLVDGKYCSDGGQAVDVTGAVKGIETDHVLPLQQHQQRRTKIFNIFGSQSLQYRYFSNDDS